MKKKEKTKLKENKLWQKKAKLPQRKKKKAAGGKNYNARNMEENETAARIIQKYDNKKTKKKKRNEIYKNSEKCDGQCDVVREIHLRT